MSRAEIQRAYRARLAAAGKVVRIVDATGAVPTTPDFDPAGDGISERQMIAGMRDQLRNALLRIEVLEEDRARLQGRNAQLESELKRQEREIINALKDKIAAQDEVARLRARRR